MKQKLYIALAKPRQRRGQLFDATVPVVMSYDSVPSLTENTAFRLLAVRPKSGKDQSPSTATSPSWAFNKATFLLIRIKDHTNTTVKIKITREIGFLKKINRSLS